jgi:hypothetical protein
MTEQSWTGKLLMEITNNVQLARHSTSDSNWEDISVEETEAGFDKALLLWENFMYLPL